MTTIAPLLAGAAFGSAAILLLRQTGMDRDRATAPILLVAIAFFYPTFAVENGGPAEIALHSVIALSFLVVALIGHARGMIIVAIAMIGHGVFDAMAHLATEGPAPRWWGPFCLAVDVVLGTWLLIAKPWQRA